MLQTKVKANSITNLTDARYFAAWDVNWLGFCLDENASEYVDARQVHAIREWVDGPAIIGEFGLQTLDQILAQATELSLDGIQLSPFADESTRLGLKDWLIIQEVMVAKDTTFADLETQLDDMAGQAGLFLLNLSASGIHWAELENSTPVSVSELQDICSRFPIIIGLSWKATELPEILEKLSPEGIYVKGGEEEKVGYKSFDEIDEVFELLEVFE